jgi:hypothetical protein
VANSKWLSVVQSVAPALATALGGPLAGSAVAAVSTAIFGRPDASEEEIEEALVRPDQNTLLQLRQANAQFEIQLRELDLDLERIAAADRSDARTRDIATKDYAAPILAAIIVAGFFGLIAALFLGAPPDASRSALDIMLGQLSGAFFAIVTYYYGTSLGSKRKTDLFAKAAEAEVDRVSRRPTP